MQKACPGSTTSGTPEPLTVRREPIGVVSRCLRLWGRLAGDLTCWPLLTCQPQPLTHRWGWRIGTDVQTELPGCSLQSDAQPRLAQGLLSCRVPGGDFRVVELPASQPGTKVAEQGRC